MSYGTLDYISDKHDRDSFTCLRDMLAARLKTGPLTYFEICQSLRAPTVGRNEVAEAIEEACTGMNSDGANLAHTYDHFYVVLIIVNGYTAFRSHLCVFSREL